MLALRRRTGHMSNMRSEGDLRVAIREAGKRTASANETLNRRMADLDRAVAERNERFGRQAMQRDARKAAEGLNLSDLDELQSLKVAPPPIAQLVSRCVCTLISGDDIGDAEALDEKALESARSSSSSKPPENMTLRERQAAASERLSSPRKSPRVPLSARGESPLSARGRSPAHSYLQQPPASARGRLQDDRNGGVSVAASPRSLTPQRRQEEASSKLSERRELFSLNYVRDSDVARVPRGELLSWDDTLKMMGRTDFKWRLRNLSGRALLDNRDLVDAVHNCLDLSSCSGQKYSILPGRAHPGDRFDENRARRELTSMLYARQKEAGVALNPLKFEEARYVNEVTGAMLIWIYRVFAQHNKLIDLWKQLSAAVEECERQVVLAKKALDLRREALEALMEEHRRLKEAEHRAIDVPKPTELTTPDQIVLTRPSPNIVFLNGRISARSNAGRCSVWDLPERLQLPSTIQFYVRLKSVRVDFPLPARYPSKQYLLQARVTVGEEELGPVAHVPFDGQHVIGLEAHHLLSFTQLVIEVPSTASVNPTIRATRLSFHPRHESQLHNYSSDRQRILVPVFATGGVGSDRSASAPPRQRPAPAAERLRKATSGLSGATERFYQIQAEHDAMMSTMDATPRPAHIPPAGVPRLAIAPPAPSVAKQHGEQTKQTLAIGSPLNTDAHFERLSARTAATVSVDGSPRSAYARSRSSLMGAWSPAVGPALSQKMRSDPLELLPFPHERSPSPPARAAAARVAAFKAESLIKPYIKRVEEGYLLLAHELRRFRQLGAMLDEGVRLREEGANALYGFAGLSPDRSHDPRRVRLPSEMEAPLFAGLPPRRNLAPPSVRNRATSGSPRSASAPRARS